MSTLHPGQVLEGTPYKVVRELGAGGMGVVYEVEHVRLRKHYVAKVMHEQIRSDESAQKRLEREADVLGKINHPNIVQVHDVGTTPDGTNYFVMDKLEGVDLRHATKHASLSPARVVAIAIDVLDALDHVHQRGIVHRDIKPENVFLAQQANGYATKVLDFGVVHIFDGDGKSSQDRITKTGGFVGTLYYAAPEQMHGQTPTPASDIYATGIMLYELLAGRGPFDDDPGVGLARCFKPAPRLGGLIPSALADVVAAALAMEPKERPNASDFAQRLRRIAATLETDPGNAGIRNEIDHLLLQVSAHTQNGGVMTEVPRTPLMRGAPAHDVPPDSPRVPTAPVSSVKGTIPIMAGVTGDRSTSPGLYATVDGSPLPRRGARGSAAMFGAIAVFVVVAGLLSVGVLTLVRSRSARQPPAAAAAAAPTSAAVAPAAAVAVPEAEAEPSVASVTLPMQPVVARSASAGPAPPKPRIGGAAPTPAPARSTGAKKDGYVDSL